MFLFDEIEWNHVEWSGSSWAFDFPEEVVTDGRRIGS